VLCSFGCVDANIKTQLLKSCCLSLYGCELWDLCHADIERICKSWRLGLRRVWGLPNDCRTAILQLLSDTLPLYDVIYKRSLLFVKRCLTSESDLVNFVSHYDVLYGRMSSVLGCNAMSCSRRYQLPVNYLLSERFKTRAIDKMCSSWIPFDYYARTMFVLEFIMLKHQVIFSPGVCFAPSDTNNSISAICTV